MPGIHSLGLNFIISIVITKKDNNQICTLNPLVKSFSNTLAYRNIIGFEKFGVIASPQSTLNCALQYFNTRSY